MLNINTIYLFSDFDKRGAFIAENENDFLTKEYLFSSNKDGSIISFNWLKGSRFYDIIATGFAGIYLVSEKVQLILKESGFKGYSLRAITLIDKKNELIRGYQLLSIVSKVGPIQNEKSIKKLMPPIVSWSDPYEAYIGLYFDVSTWDGSHFFYPEGTSYIFVLEEVKKLFEEIKISNCKFKKVIELENYGFM